MLKLNNLGETEVKNTKLLGLLQRKCGYIRDKGELAYEDSSELASIVSAIRKMTKKDDIRAIVFIARYGQPLLAIKTSKSDNRKGGQKWVRY